MTKNEFYDALELMRKEMRFVITEDAMFPSTDASTYAKLCNVAFMHNYAITSGKELDSSLYLCLSLEEANAGVNGVLSVVTCWAREYCDNIKKLSELVLCVNWKAWEHADRQNERWGRFYSKLYCTLDEMILEYYEGREDEISYYIRFLD